MLGLALWLRVGACAAENVYEVRFAAGEMQVEGRVPAGQLLTMGPGVAWRVTAMETETDGRWQPVSGYHHWKVTGHFRYRYALPQDEPLWTTCFSEFLALPSSSEAFRLHLVTDSTHRFASALKPVGPDLYEADEKSREALCVCGPFALRQGAEITLAYLPGRLRLSDNQLEQWVERSAAALCRYVGRFPVERVLLVVKPVTGEEIRGVTFGEGGAGIILAIPPQMEALEILEGWQLTHELVHLCIPSLPASHHWLEEGLASYLEPLVRSLPASKVWAELRAGLPRGLPRPDGPGLDDDDSWASTYWGGALFCLLSDIEYRRHSRNAHTLQEALQAVVAEGGNVTQKWTLAHFLEVADGPSGSTAMKNLHQKMGARACPIDLDSLWRELAGPLDYVRHGICDD